MVCISRKGKYAEQAKRFARLAKKHPEIEVKEKAVCLPKDLYEKLKKK